MDKLDQAEQQLAALAQSIVAEDYELSARHLELLDEQIQNLFLVATENNTFNFTRLQTLSINFAKLIDDLSDQRNQIKDSISQLASVKSGNKVAKTYHIDKDK